MPPRNTVSSPAATPASGPELADVQQLAPPPRLSNSAEAALQRYASLLLEWNRQINLSGARDMATLWRRHIADCLWLQCLPCPKTPLRVLDLGSGAGLPGVVWALLRPQDSVVTLDSVAKKITFQQVARGRLGLENLTPLRAEATAYARTLDDAALFDLVLARAVAPLPQLAALAAPLLRPGGRLWAMKGQRVEAELAAFAQLPAKERAHWADAPLRYTYPVSALPGGIGDTEEAGRAGADASKSGEAAIVELRRCAPSSTF